MKKDGSHAATARLFADLVQYQDEYRPAALRFDVGERSNFTLLPMLAAALDLILDWTVPAIQDYCAQLTGPLTQTLQERGYWIEEDRWRGAHLFGIRRRGTPDMARVAARLDARQVFVSVRGDAIRIAPHLYNDVSDTDALLDALGD